MTGRGRQGGRTIAFGAALLLPLAIGPVALSRNPAPSLVPVPLEARIGGRTVLAAARGEAAPKLRLHRRRALSILQLGDSHTAADQFTGTVRQVLQARFGAGGPGLVPAGLPHPGVRSTELKLSASPGWTYESLQRAASPGAFGLSGFNATAQREGENLTFTSERPLAYTRVEIEVLTGPEAGSLAVEIDGIGVLSQSLASDVAKRVVLRARPPEGQATFRQLVLRTIGAKPVTISGVGIFREDAGLTYSSVGYPGATVAILDAFAPGALAEALRRLAPDLVVLAFGTNEGFDNDLDLSAYRERYDAALRTIRQGAPQARLVMIGPPQGERAPAPCKPGIDGRPCAAAAATAGEDAPGREACRERPPRLAQVRQTQRRLAAERGIAFWDWWAIMPEGCGAARWLAADPPLMARDRVHFTRAGYRASGQAFAAFVEDQVTALLGGDHAVPNH